MSEVDILIENYKLGNKVHRYDFGVLCGEIARLRERVETADFCQEQALEAAKQAVKERDGAIAQMNIAIASEKEAREELAKSVSVERVRAALDEAYDRTANVGLAVKLVAAMLGIDLDEPDDGQE